MMTQAEFDTMVERATLAAAAYYDNSDGDLQMTDDEYDTLLQSIEAALANDPLLYDDNAAALLTKVAAGASKGGDVTHAHPMLSLDKTKDIDGVTKFLKTLPSGASVVVEPKMDGMAVSATYVNGRLALLATRGDGMTGENVTSQATNINGDPIKGLPLTVPGDFTGEVRGEVYMTTADLDATNVGRTASGKKPLKNERNGVAGSLRKTDADYPIFMSFAAYSVHVEKPDFNSHALMMAALARVGFGTAQALVPGYDPTNPAKAELIGEKRIMDAINNLEEARSTLGFPIDGAVITVNDDYARATLGAGSRTPKWALAYKYAPLEATSVLRDIEIAIGRTGQVSFTAVFDEVYVGADLTRATLHNITFIEENNLGIGKKIMVSRANDVIPRVVGLDAPENEGIPNYVPPTTCPQCGEEFDTTSPKKWRCHSPECSAAGWLAYWCSRDALDIDGVGDTICESLVEADLASTPADLYDLTVETLTTLPLTDGRLLGEKNAVKIAAQIEASKSQPFNRVITGLGIRMTGRSVGRWLANEYKNMDALRAATVEDIATMNKLGEKKGTFIVNGLKARATVIDRLAAAGVTMSVEDTDEDTNTPKPFTGMTVVVSGSVPGLTRNEANEWVERLGGKSSGSVSKNTTLLVAGDGAGSKAEKATALGVKVMPAEEFAALVETSR